MFVPLELKEVKSMEQGIPAIVVPFREQVEQQRGEQLKKFVSHMSRYHSDWPVIIVEQSDDGRKINLGALKNIGARIAFQHKYKYVIFNDVDLIPLAKIVPYYTTYPTQPIHIGKAWTSKYDSPSFLGGVVSISKEDMEKTNGYPNMFWGWGGEDDALRNRLKRKKISVFQPTLRGEGFRELTHVDSRTIKENKNMRKWEDVAEDTGKHGFKDVRYKILDVQESGNVKKITVEL